MLAASRRREQRLESAPPPLRPPQQVTEDFLGDGGAEQGARKQQGRGAIEAKERDRDGHRELRRVPVQQRQVLRAQHAAQHHGRQPIQQALGIGPHVHVQHEGPHDNGGAEVHGNEGIFGGKRGHGEHEDLVKEEEEGPRAQQRAREQQRRRHMQQTDVPFET